MEQLVLFDIDGTLLVTSGAGSAAMVGAGRELFGAGFTAAGMDFSGRLDPLLIDEMLALNGVEGSEGRRREFRARYQALLEARAAEAERSGTPLARALPGVHALLGRMRESGAPMGLLTGNFAETGAIKLRSCGIDPAWFTPAVWGDESPHCPPRRDHLPAVAMTRVLGSHGVRIEPGRVTVIGDTPHDVGCARANGCRAVGVATGRFTVAQLEAAGADHVLADLSGTEAVYRVLVGW